MMVKPRSVLSTRPVMNATIMAEVFAALAEELSYPVRDVQHARKRLSLLSDAARRWSRAQ